MNAARRGHSMKAGQSIGEYPSACVEVLLRLGDDFGGAEPSVMATVRTDEAIGSSPSIQGIEALVFGFVEGEEFVETDSFLELHWVARHGNFLIYH